MIELIVGLLGAGTFLVVYNKFLKGYVTIKQKETEKKSKEINDKVENLEKDKEKIKEEANREIKEIKDEQNKDPSSSDLVDFFDKRNK